MAPHRIVYAPFFSINLTMTELRKNNGLFIILPDIKDIVYCLAKK